MLRPYAILRISTHQRTGTLEVHTTAREWRRCGALLSAELEPVAVELLGYGMTLEQRSDLRVQFPVIAPRPQIALDVGDSLCPGTDAGRPTLKGHFMDDGLGPPVACYRRACEGKKLQNRVFARNRRSSAFARKMGCFASRCPPTRAFLRPCPLPLS
jgi:hypothetical protein